MLRLGWLCGDPEHEEHLHLELCPPLRPFLGRRPRRVAGPVGVGVDVGVGVGVVGVGVGVGVGGAGAAVLVLVLELVTRRGGEAEEEERLGRLHGMLAQRGGEAEVVQPQRALVRVRVKVGIRD